MLTIEISRACGTEPDFMDRLARVINRLAIRYISTGS